MARRCTTAYARARRTRRRFSTLLLTLVVGGLVAVGPSFMASASDDFDRLVVAEGRGDTARLIAQKIGHEISFDTQVPATLTVTPTASGDCLIAEIGMPVECEAVVKIKHLAGGEFRIIANRHGERYVYDSSYGA